MGGKLWKCIWINLKNVPRSYLDHAKKHRLNDMNKVNSISARTTEPYIGNFNYFINVLQNTLSTFNMWSIALRQYNLLIQAGLIGKYNHRLTYYSIYNMYETWQLSLREYIIRILTSTQPNSDFMSIITLPFLEYQWDNCSFIVL